MARRLLLILMSTLFYKGNCFFFTRSDIKRFACVVYLCAIGIVFVVFFNSNTCNICITVFYEILCCELFETFCLIIFFIVANSLTCYQCIPETSIKCTETKVECAVGQCGTMKTTSYMGKN